jgi:hypothetical protein
MRRVSSKGSRGGSIDQWPQIDITLIWIRIQVMRIRNRPISNHCCQFFYLPERGKGHILSNCNVQISSTPHSKQLYPLLIFHLLVERSPLFEQDETSSGFPFFPSLYNQSCWWGGGGGRWGFHHNLFSKLFTYQESILHPRRPL